MTALLFVLGLALLVGGAEALVRGASRLARAAGLSPLVVGLTVVAFGTSTPELAVSTGATLVGDTDIALGNVVGSNIFNLLFILGLSALVAALDVGRELVREQVPVMIGVSVLLLLITLNGVVSRVEGAALFSGLILYTGVLVVRGRRSGEREDVAASADGGTGGVLWSCALVAAGLVLLVLGSGWVVEGAERAAAAFGISELTIGLTIVAAGTSLPELATSVVATVRGERDLAVGNVVGSNVFNILGIVGVSSVLSPVGLAAAPRAVAVDIPVMVFVAVVCLPVFATGRRVSRTEGALFLAGYVAYTVWLLRAAG